MIMAVNTADKTSLEIKRFINAPRDRVYAAWTDPAQLKQWWGPEGVRTRNFTATRALAADIAGTCLIMKAKR